MGATGKHLIVYFLVLLLGAPAAWARPTTETEAQRSVAGWLALDQRPLKANMGAKTGRVQGHKDSAGNTAYFVVNLEPGGFVVVAGDDLLEPIIAFAPRGSFDPNPQNPLYVLLNRDLPGRLAEVRAKEDQARKRGQKFIPKGLHRRAQGKWARLQIPNPSPTTLLYSMPSISDLRVEPMVQSKWGQGDEGGLLCYNYYTPYNYLAGCVATALAQILRHYSLPSGPVGMTRFDVLVNYNPTYRWLLGGDGSGGAYDWGNMVLDPDGSTPDMQRQAIGALTHDAGVAVHTSYALSGSGAYTRNVAIALKTTFGFGNANYGYNGTYTIPSANLNNMINPNLDARFPAILGITEASGNGHEVVVDGYGYNVSTLYHHLNLGWSGTEDVWYNLPTISTSNYNFNAVIETVYNIFPQGSGEIISGRVLDAVGQPVSGAAITASDTVGNSYTATSDSQGIYALARLPAASTYTITASKAGYVFFPKTVNNGTSLDGNTATGNLWGIDFVENLADLTLNQALDNDKLAFLTGGDVNWSGQTAVSFFAGSSAQTAALGNNQATWLQTTVVGPGTLSFHWKVSSEADYDFLEVFLDEVLQPGAISGEVDWQQKTISIPAGSHIVKWNYGKDNAISLGSDCGWVDKVSFRPSRHGHLVPVLKLLLLGG